MNIRMFPYYLLSGSIFLGWYLLFYYSYNINDFNDIKLRVLSLSVTSLLLLIIALISIGMIIHQLSVSVKNQLLGNYCNLPYFIDSIIEDDTLTQNIIGTYSNSFLDSTRVKTNILHSQISIIHQKISGLDKQCYLRFDNGGLAPILAFMSFVLMNSIKENSLLTSLLIILSIIFIIVLLIKCFYPKNEQHPIISTILKVLSFAYTVFKIREYYLNKNYIKLFFILSLLVLVLIKYIIKVLILFIIKNIGVVFLLVSTMVMLSLLVYHDNMLLHIENSIFITSLIIAIVYIFFMLSYIPALYNKRKECFEYYDRFVNQNNNVTVYNSTPKYKKHNPSV